MPSSPNASSGRAVPIDVLIPAIEKDLATLPHVVAGLRRHVRHPIRRILIIAPRRPKMLAFCKAHNCSFIDENTVLPIVKKDIHYRSRTWERSGWLFQQLLKLSGDRLCTADFFLVIDADTVLIRPHTFRRNGRTVLYCRNWSQEEYFRTYRKLMGSPKKAPTSFVTHYMLFERRKLAQMKREMETRHGTSWYKAILRSMNRSRPFAFSEFETYGNYLYTTDRGGIIMRKARNKSLNLSASALTASRTGALAARYRSVSLHKRKDYSIKPKAGSR